MSMGKPGTVSTYSGVHMALKRVRGNANTHTCSCGAQAKDWAYMGGDPDERIDQRDGAYSLDLDRYQPMCRPCHKRMDYLASVTKCPHGHEYTPQNTYIDKVSGARRCRKCRSIRDAEIYSKSRKPVQPSA